MPNKIKINNTDVKIIKDDLTALEVDAFIFYARTDLALGSGYGNAISTRGGPSIKAELDKIGKADMSDAVLTSSGELNSKYIIHAVGPGFQEDDSEDKLKKAVLNSLKCSDKNQISTLAFPIMGSGFYGIAPEKSIEIMYNTVKEHLHTNNTALKEVIFCANDNRELGFLNNQISIFEGVNS